MDCPDVVDVRFERDEATSLENVVEVPRNAQGSWISIDEALKAWGALSVLLVVLLSGCVSKSEYRTFVGASRGFYDAVAPVVSDAALRDPNLSEQSRKNRLATLAAHERAIRAAEERTR